MRCLNGIGCGQFCAGLGYCVLGQGGVLVQRVHQRLLLQRLREHLVDAAGNEGGDVIGLSIACHSCEVQLGWVALG